MFGFIIRCFLTAGLLFSTVALFYSGYWGWGITLIFPTAIVIFSFFRNEQMVLALNAMRTGDTDKAKARINKITAPQFLPKKQHAYVLFLKAVLNTQELGFTKSENLLRKAIDMGLRTAQDNAVARMHLAGICAQTGRKKEATTLMQGQLRATPSKNQMRMAQMIGGRRKTPRR
jgi:hypothetical protein